MFHLFEGQTADDVWCEIADAAREGKVELQKGRGGATYELLHAAISITDPRQRWVVSRQPALNVAFALAEIVWIVNGRNDSAFLHYFNRQIARFAGEGPIFHGAYGHRLRIHFGFDQLQRAFDVLRAKPTSRQVVLQIWDGTIDLPSASGEEAAADIPCNVLSLLKVRSEKLEWMQIMRSNDVQLGLPHNIVQFTAMQEILAGWLGLDIGTYHQISDSLHVYERDWPLQFSRVKAIPNVDRIALPKRESDQSFQTLANAIDIIIDEANSSKQVQSLVNSCGLSTPFRNMLCVFCAEGVRRRGSPQIAAELMADCTNETYAYLYAKWLERLAKPEKS